MNIKRYKRHIQGTVWPHRNNSWHPYVLRAPALTLVAASLTAMVIGLNVIGGGRNILGVAENITGSDILHETNNARLKAGLRPLVVNDDLNRAAAAKARHMLDGSYWNHYGPNGETPWQFIRESGYYYSSAGENLARDFQTSSGVVEGWMNSSGHRENLLSQEFQEMGVAAVDGTLNGRKTTIVVAFYANPSQYRSIAIGNSSEGGGEVLPAQTSYSVFNPLNLFATMPFASRIIGLVLLNLGSIYLAQHLVIRKQHLLWDKHIHPRPVLQCALLFGFTIMLIQASFGVVG